MGCTTGANLVAAKELLEEINELEEEAGYAALVTVTGTFDGTVIATLCTF